MGASDGPVITVSSILIGQPGIRLVRCVGTTVARCWLILAVFLEQREERRRRG